MANSLSHVLPYPIKNCLFTLEVSFRVAAGTPTDPTTPDTELSSDGGATFADCTNEITTGGTNGAGYLTLTSTETNNNVIWIAAKSANCLTTLVALYPRVLASVGTGTLSAGSAGGGTLGTLLAYDVTGCFIKTTGGTGGAAGAFQARKIVTYNTSTGAFTVAPNWETTPDATTTYDVLLPEGVTLGMLKTLNPTTAGRTLDVSSGGEAGLDWANIGSPTTSNNLSGTSIATSQVVASVSGAVGSVTGSIGSVGTGGIVAASFGTGAIDAAALAADAGTEIGTAVWASGTRTITGGTITTYTGNTVQTGDSYARLGAPAGASIAADIATKATSAALTTLSNIFSGITSLAQWLGAMAGKQTANSTARTEIRATGAGSGTYDETTDAQEAIRDALPTGTGTGARTVTVTVNDGASALESVNVRFTKGAESYVAQTNASGQKVFSLDDGTWTVNLTLPGYTFTSTTLVVDGTETPTYSMTALTISPSSPGLTTGYYVVYELGVPVSGTEVSIIDHNPAVSSTGIIALDTLRTDTSAASTGLVEFTNLFKGSQIRVKIGDGEWSDPILIPAAAGATVALASLFPNS